MENGYQRAARAKYRFAHITGDGPHACVSKCTMQRRVHLFASIEQAEFAASKPCGSIACRMGHEVESFEPAVPQPYVAWAHFADWD